MIFNWNIDDIPRQELPPHRQEPERLAYLKALLKPIKTLYNSFVSYRRVTIKKLRYNGQTIILQNYLNDLFDPTLRRIRILTVFDLDMPLYVGLDSEPDPVYLGLNSEPSPLYLGLNSETGYLFHFIVEAATGSLTAQQIVRLKAVVNYYRLAGKKPFYRYNNLTPF